YGFEFVAMSVALTRRERSMWCRRRATVLAESGLSICWRTSAIFSVVLPVDFNPVMGSPAVSCSRRISIASIISGVFFPPAYVQRRLCARGPLPRPERVAAVVHGRRCADRGRGNQPVGDRRHGPV